jgi:hypothetical protein
MTRRHALEEQRRKETIFTFGLILAFMWTEIQRRLGVLNHAHEKAVEVQHTYVTQEKFDDFRQTFDDDRSRKSDELSETRGGNAASIRWTAIGVTVAIAFVIVLANVLTSR